MEPPLRHHRRHRVMCLVQQEVWVSRDVHRDDEVFIFDFDFLPNVIIIIIVYVCK